MSAFRWAIGSTRGLLRVAKSRPLVVSVRPLTARLPTDQPCCQRGQTAWATTTSDSFVVNAGDLLPARIFHS